MTEEKPDFVVCIENDDVIVRINGKATYMNCSPINDFFERILMEGHNHFEIDFANCLGMDSTFLGVLAGVASKTMRNDPQGDVVFANLSPQNKQLIRGLGLHHLPTVKIEDNIDYGCSDESSAVEINGIHVDKEANHEMILEAHERLMELNRANERRFQDVVKYLRRDVD